MLFSRLQVFHAARGRKICSVLPCCRATGCFAPVRWLSRGFRDKHVQTLDTWILHRIRRSTCRGNILFTYVAVRGVSPPHLSIVSSINLQARYIHGKRPIIQITLRYSNARIALMDHTWYAVRIIAARERQGIAYSSARRVVILYC